MMASGAYFYIRVQPQNRASLPCFVGSQGLSSGPERFFKQSLEEFFSETGLPEYFILGNQYDQAHLAGPPTVLPSGTRAGQRATCSTTLPGTPDLRLASKASRPCSNGNTSPTMDLSSPASIRRASSASAARSGSTTKKTPRAPGRPASSNGDTTETSTPPGLTTAQDRSRISPPPGRRPFRLRPPRPRSPGDRCPRTRPPRARLRGLPPKPAP